MTPRKSRTIQQVLSWQPEDGASALANQMERLLAGLLTQLCPTSSVRVTSASQDLGYDLALNLGTRDIYFDVKVTPYSRPLELGFVQGAEAAVDNQTNRILITNFIVTENVDSKLRTLGILPLQFGLSEPYVEFEIKLQKTVELAQLGSWRTLSEADHDTLNARDLVEVLGRQQEPYVAIGHGDSTRHSAALSGNLPRATAHFVGREVELQELAQAVFDGHPGSIVVLHGLGGIGKSELAVEFAWRHQERWAAGAWKLNAAGRTELLPLIGGLTYDLGLPPSAGPDETSEMRGRRVLAELKRRAVACGTPEQGGATLLIIDNATETALLAEPQVNCLPEEGWLKLIITTRLGKAALPTRDLHFIAVDCLPEEAAVHMVRNRQQDGHWPATTAKADEEAACALVRELGGFTLTIETVAIYLGQHSEIRPADLLARLRSEGVASTDALATQEPDVAAQLLHREKQLSQVLQATLEQLTPPARTALDFAALLPPDSLPWPWLRALVEHEHSDAFRYQPGYPDPWAAIRRQLEDLRLLTAAGHPEVSRLHRLISAHLRSRLSASETAAKIELLRNHLVDVALELQGVWRHSVDHLWQLAPLQAAAADWGPDTRDWRFGIICATVGEIEMTLGRLDLAEPFLQEALETHQAIYQASPESERATRHLSLSLEKFADFLTERGQPGDAERALEYYERSLNLHESLLRANLQSTRAFRDVSICLHNLANFLAQRGQPGDADRALAYYQRNLELSEQLLRDDPQSAEFVRDVAVSQSKLGDFLVQRGHPGDAEQALAYYVRSLDLNEQLLRANPQSAEFVRDVAVSQSKLGDFLAQRGHPGDAEQALANYARSLDLSEQLLRANPQSTRAVRDVGNNLERLAGALAKRGQPGDVEQALLHYQRSLSVREDLLRANPQSALAQRDVATSLNKLADLWMQRRQPGDVTRALAYYERSLNISVDLLGANPQSALAMRDVLFSLERLATATDTDDSDIRREMDGSFQRLAGITDVERTANPRPTALHLQQQALDLAKQLWNHNPTSAYYGRIVVSSYWRTAQLALTAGEQDLTAQCLRDCHTVLKQLISDGYELDTGMRDLFELLDRSAFPD